MSSCQRSQSVQFAGPLRRALFAACLLLLVSLACALPALEQTTPTPGPNIPAGDVAVVTRIIDGDTIDVEIDGDSYRLRYIGMDTPERDEPFYEAATEANRRLVSGQTVILVKDVSETDRFGRLLRYVYLEDGLFINAELVRQGMAQIATFPPDVRHQDLFLALQREARAAGRGLWSEAFSAPQPTQPPP